MKKKRSYRAWTDADDHLLSHLHAIGTKRKEIARQMKRSVGVIHAKMKQLGIVSPNPNYAKDQYSEPDPHGRLDDRPCDAAPGTLERIEWMRRRMEQGLELNHPDDRMDYESLNGS